MLILPQSLFITKFSDKQLYRFELKDEAYRYIENQLKGKIYRHGSVYRRCKDHCRHTLIIIIPRLLLCTSSKSVTHVVLPDFLLPNIQYSLKTVTVANSEQMSSCLNSYMEKCTQLWDDSCEVLSKMDKRLMSYLQHRLTAIIFRIRCYVSLLKAFSRTLLAKFGLSPCFADFYFLNENKEIINPIYYLDPVHTVFSSG